MNLKLKNLLQAYKIHNLALTSKINLPKIIEKNIKFQEADKLKKEVTFNLSDS